MNYAHAFAAGIFGTLLMTSALYILSAILKKNYKVVGILATMITNHATAEKGLTKKPGDLLAGMALHYLIGIMFAGIYYYLWDAGAVPADITTSLLLGLINGIMAMLFWYSFIRLHPRPPAIPVMSFIMFVGLCHLLFSLGVWIVYTLYK
jgi:hypothetical protein